MIYKIDFNCDMDRFMHFFKRTYTQSTGRGGYRSKHDDGLLPLNEVTGDMIKLCDKTIQKEKASVTQADWDKMWEGKNRFEIMEAVWKKWIVEEKADASDNRERCHSTENPGCDDTRVRSLLCHYSRFRCSWSPEFHWLAKKEAIRK